MPLCTLHLLSLTPTTTFASFLSSLRDASLSPIIQSKVVRWVILPKVLSTVPLLSYNTHWDLLILLPGTSPLPNSVSSQIAAQWHVIVGVPSRLLQDFSTKNSNLLNPPAGSVKLAEKPNEALARSTQNLELTSELQSWISSLTPRQRDHPISMLNLLSFNPGKKEEYLKYGSAFSKSIGSRHGGEAKIVGNVIHNRSEGRPMEGRGEVGEEGDGEGWDEIAIAHYPSLQHFAAMAGSKDYQDVNQKFRVGALRDTFILCTMEIDDEGELAGGKSGSGPKL